MSGNLQLKIFILTACSLLCLASSAQEDTSTREKNNLFHNIFQRVKGAVYVNKRDSIVQASILNAKSEIPFLEYSGKIIRHIRTRQLGFEIPLSDTSSRITYFGTKILNALHIDTRSWVIRENLFIKENTVLNPYEVADNERYLRTLEFIQDARIIVTPISGVTDSVDLIVITKDLFSITGSFSIGSVNRVRARIAETNLFGAGQKVQFSALLDRKRDPIFGYELLYSKTSVANSFINVTLGYTLINTGIRQGTENEKAAFVRLERPLLSPYAHLAGGFEMSKNTSQNVYLRPDSSFFDYGYNLFDLWAGYNLGSRSKVIADREKRNRTFLAFRYLNKNFTHLPVQIGNGLHYIYNSKKLLLSEVTLFKQDFYNMNYIYGFGTTEDVPDGYNIAVTGGWTKQLTLERPYFGVNANKFIATRKGQFMQYFFRSGLYLKKGNVQDATLMLGGNFYSRLYLYKKTKIRELIKFSFTRVMNPVTSEPLRIDNPLGLQYFRSDSVLGTQRLSLYAETFLFLPGKIFGFQMAPFFYGDLSLMTPRDVRIWKSDLYSGIGGGLRTRNENLVFGTLEARFSYFPRPADKMNHFAVSFKSNIQFRFNNRYVKSPEVILVNTDDVIRTY